MVDDLIRSFLNLHPDTPIDGQEYAVPLRVVKRLLEAGMKVEREACAKVCEDNASIIDYPSAHMGGASANAKRKAAGFAEAIRARGQE